MSEQSRYWRVVFGADGAIASVDEVAGPEAGDWIVVKARNATEAEDRASRAYRARMQRQRRTEAKAQGLCPCGQPRDREHPSGGLYVSCRRCHARHVRSNALQLGKPAPPPPPKLHISDRLSVLIEVKSQWINSRNVGLFGKWLQQEIDSLQKGAAA